ncbi:hypothetical protein ACWIGW_03750 [Nocardia brasiliensis]
MIAVRGFAGAALIAAATLAGTGAAGAAPLPLEPHTPVATESVAGSCGGNPAPCGAVVGALRCLPATRGPGFR